MPRDREDKYTPMEKKFGDEGAEAIHKFHEEIGKKGGGRVSELIKEGKESERRRREGQ